MALKPFTGWGDAQSAPATPWENDAGSSGEDVLPEDIQPESPPEPYTDNHFLEASPLTSRNDVILGAVNPTDVTPILPEFISETTPKNTKSSAPVMEEPADKPAKFDYMDCIDSLHMPYDLARAFEEICQDTMFDCTVDKVQAVLRFVKHRIERGDATIDLTSEYSVFQVIEQLGLSYIGGRVVEGIFEYCTTGKIDGLIFASAGLSYIVDTLTVSL